MRGPQEIREWLYTQSEDAVAHRIFNLREENRVLKEKISSQKRELTNKDETLAHRSRALDAMYWVWCDGGCGAGVNRHQLVSPLTEEIVKAAEHNTKRLRRWIDNVNFKAQMKELRLRHEGVHTLTLWYLAHMERGTFERIMSEPYHPKDPDKIAEAERLYTATQQNTSN